MAAQISEHTKHYVVHFKWMDCILCELYLTIVIQKYNLNVSHSLFETFSMIGKPVIIPPH